MNLNIRKQSDGGTVRKAIVEFHAENTCPVMCQVFRCNEHRSIINVVCEGSGIGHRTQQGKTVPSLHSCKAPERSGWIQGQESTWMTIICCVGACKWANCSCKLVMQEQMYFASLKSDPAMAQFSIWSARFGEAWSTEMFRYWKCRQGKKVHKNNSVSRFVSGTSFCPDWLGNLSGTSDHPWNHPEHRPQTQRWLLSFVVICKVLTALWSATGFMPWVLLLQWPGAECN